MTQTDTGATPPSLAPGDNDTPGAQADAQPGLDAPIERGPGLGEPVSGQPLKAGAGIPIEGAGFGRAIRSLDVLHGVEMTVTVELGRTRLLLRDLLALRSGSIIELDHAAGSPVDVLVNGTLLAHGEVVVVDDEFGVRVTDIVAGDETQNPN